MLDNITLFPYFGSDIVFNDSNDYDSCAENCSTDLRDIGSWDENNGILSSNFYYLANILTRCVTVVISLAVLSINSIIFSATRKVHLKTLQSKPLILNSIVADMLFNIGSTLVMVWYIFQALGSPRNVYVFVRGLANHLNSGALYAQVFSGVILAVDRMYAVVMPMAYYTVGYNTLSRVGLITFSWLCAISLMSVGMVSLFAGDNSSKQPLNDKLMEEFQRFAYLAKPATAIGVNVFTFLLYGMVFVVFILQKRKNSAVERSTAKYRSGILSLTLTFFFIQLTTLGFYLPAPILRLFSELFIGTSGQIMEIYIQIFIMLFILNTSVNSIILAVRVRLIRRHVVSILKFENIRKTNIPRCRYKLDSQETTPTG